MKKGILFILIILFYNLNLFAQNSRFQYNGLNGNSTIEDFERVMINMSLDKVNSQDPFNKYIAYGGIGGSVHFIVRGEFDENNKLMNILVFYMYNSPSFSTIYDAYNRLKKTLVRACSHNAKE